MMRRSHFFTSIAAVAVLLCSAASISAQVGQLRGSVKLIGADGHPAPVAGATVDVFRTDLPGDFHTKSDKKGEWVFAGLPYVGTYIVSISAPGAQPNAKGGVKAGREVPVDVILAAGDGRRLTSEEAKAASAGGSTSSSGGAGESASDKAKREELARKNAELAKENEKNININKVVGEAFKAGNTALNAKNYDEALKQYDMGLAADAEQPSLLTNKTLALKARGVDRYNAAIQTKDEAARTSGLELAKADFKAAAEAANKAADLIKKVPPATEPAEQKQQAVNRYATMSARAEAMRLFVTKADGSQADAGAAAFEDYIAVETDAAKKSKAQLDMAQMLLDAGAGDKAFAAYQKILAERPDDPDANLGAGLALYSMGDKARYQEAANYFQHFVDKAPDNHKFKNDAKDILANLKNTENVVPEKTNTPPRRKRP
jgi:tetratricopeptide (TPR) repeat protein